MTSPQWPYRGADGYSSSTPNTPAQLGPTTPASGNSQLDPSSHSGEPANAQPSLLPQQPALSPHGSLDTELKKQTSVSSLRDALLSTPNSASQQQYSAYSPRVPGGHPSPMTPSANFPHTPDASTPTGGSTMSPHVQQHYEDRSDGQLPAESELINSFGPHNSEEEGRPLRVSPFQVESILGIQNDKPIDYDANFVEANSVDGQERNPVVSPKRTVQDHKANVRRRSENSSKPNDAQPSPSLSKVDSLPVSSHSEDADAFQVSIYLRKFSSQQKRTEIRPSTIVDVWLCTLF